MHKLLLFLALFALLLEPAVAASLSMEHTFPVAPMAQFYQQSELCQRCDAATTMSGCMCMMLSHIDPALLQLPPVHTGRRTSCDDTEAKMALVAAYTADHDRKRLLDHDHVQQLNENATTVQRDTVQGHLQDIYTPGYPQRPVASSNTEHMPPARQNPRRDGFPCTSEGCEQVFDHAHKLNRHQKTHLKSSDRPHKCTSCGNGFLYPKDLKRHYITHHKLVQLTCRISGCNKSFAREDNRLRHERNQRLHVHMHMQPLTYV